MSARLQIVVAEEELREIKAAARRHDLTVADWVRGALSAACEREPGRDKREKLGAVREACRHAFPTASIEDVLADIERDLDPKLDRGGSRAS